MLKSSFFFNSFKITYIIFDRFSEQEIFHKNCMQFCQKFQLEIGDGSLFSHISY